MFLFISEYDTSLRQVIRTHLDLDLVTRKYLDVMHPHLTGDIADNLLTNLQIGRAHV